MDTQSVGSQQGILKSALKRNTASMDASSGFINPSNNNGNIINTSNNNSNNQYNTSNNNSAAALNNTSGDMLSSYNPSVTRPPSSRKVKFCQTVTSPTGSFRGFTTPNSPYIVGNDGSNNNLPPLLADPPSTPIPMNNGQNINNTDTNLFNPTTNLDEPDSNAVVSTSGFHFLLTQDANPLVLNHHSNYSNGEPPVHVVPNIYNNDAILQTIAGDHSDNTSNNHDLTNPPIQVFFDSGQRDVLDDISSISTEPDTDAIEDPEIPYSNNGHHYFHPKMHLSYEYMRNPEYHNLFPFLTPLSRHGGSHINRQGRIYNLLCAFFTIPRVERINYASSQGRAMKEHQLQYKEALSTNTEVPMIISSGHNINSGETQQHDHHHHHHNSPAKKYGKHTTSTTSKHIHNNEWKEALLGPHDGDDDDDNKNDDDDDDYNMTTKQKRDVDAEQIYYDTTLLQDSDLERATGFFDWPSRAETFVQLILAIPLMISFTCSYALGLINLYYQGKISEQALAAAGVASMGGNVLGNAIVFGLNNGLDTLGSHSYGAMKYKMIGLYALRGMLISLLVSIGIATIWWYSYYPFLWMGIEHDIASLAQNYLRYSIPSLPAITIFDILRRYLEVQQNSTPPMIVNLVALAFVFPLNEFFIHYLNFGYLGPAFTTNIINWLMCILLIIYIRASGVLETAWPDRTFTRHLFKGWGLYLRYAIPSMLMCSLEWCAFEAQLLITSRMHSTAAVAAQNVITTFNAALFCFPMSLGLAGSARIGAFFGQKQTACAMHAYLITKRLTWACTAVVSMLVFFLNHQIATLFVGDNAHATKEIVITIIPFLSVFHLLDGHQGSLCQVARGMGKQNFSVVLNFIGFWVIALPLAWYLSLHVGSHTYLDDGVSRAGLGLIGQWVALLSACAVVLTSYFTHFGLMSWTKWQGIVSADVGDQLVA